VADAWIVAGLGNPGDRYARTRHNVGTMVVDRLAERLGVRFRKARLLPLLVAEANHEGVPLLLTGPVRYMNEGGPPIASLARKRGVPPERIVAVHDELDLAFGALRVKQGGSTAGHHGLDSLVGALRTPGFYRVRLGIGRPPGRQEPMDFVLDPFAKREADEVEALIEDGADAVLSLVHDGLNPTQSRFNRGGARTS
jgi:PTH1 family peptidyl-tRNA hydrolase